MTYSEPWWLTYRFGFIARMLSLGVIPYCGATMPGGPSAHLSRCRQAGLKAGASRDGSSLHFHHEPELTEGEYRAIAQGDRRAAMDDLRIVLLCRECHSAETMTGRESPDSLSVSR